MAKEATKSKKKREFQKRITANNPYTIYPNTFDRLFEIEKKAIYLYMFCCNTASKQGTITIYCTNSFIQKGLAIGKEQLLRLKSILVKNGFIEPVIKRNSEGQIIGNYIKVNYLTLGNTGSLKTSLPVKGKNTPEGGLPEGGLPEAGKQTTNTVYRNKYYNKELNAEKLNSNELSSSYSEDSNIFFLEKISPEEKELFNYWNSSASDSSLTVHKSIFSKCRVSGKKTEKLLYSIRESLEKYSVIEIKKSIKNYMTVFNDDTSFYDHKFSLAQFLTSEKGLSKFLPSEILNAFKKETDSFGNIIKKFKPICHQYDTKNVFNKDKGTYYGIDTEYYLKDPFYRLDNIEFMIKNKMEFSFDVFWSLEVVIAGFLWNRSRDKEKHLDKVTELVNLWEEKLPEFRTELRKKLINGEYNY